MNIIKALIAPPGAGKSQWLINHINQHRNDHSILVFPTLNLSDEIRKRLEELTIPFNTINSQSVEGGTVVEHLEEALINKNDNVIVCTHAALLLINPDYLCGWNLYVDEVPSTWDCSNPRFTDISYHDAFDSIVNLEQDEGGKYERMIAKDNKHDLIDALSKGKDNAYNTPTRLVFEKLLSENYAIEVDELDKDLYRTVRIIGFKDYLSAFEAADEVTILCAELHKTFMGVILKGAGWRIEEIEFDSKFNGYGNKVIIKPFLSKQNYSKRLALQKEVDFPSEYVGGCNIDKWLKEVFDEVGKRKAILVGHSWLDVELPIPEGEEFSNISRVNIDNRGINEFKDRTIAICLQHGNLSPIEGRSLSTLASMLSIEKEVTTEEIREAIKYERFYESTLQSACRTALRDRGNNSKVTLYVQDMSMAEFLTIKLGNTIIDDELSISPFRVESPVKVRRDGLKAEAIQMHKEGYSTKEIAAAVEKDARTIQRWLKPYIQLHKTAS